MSPSNHNRVHEERLSCRPQPVHEERLSRRSQLRSRERFSCRSQRGSGGETLLALAQDQLAQPPLAALALLLVCRLLYLAGRETLVEGSQPHHQLEALLFEVPPVDRGGCQLRPRAPAEE